MITWEKSLVKRFCFQESNTIVQFDTAVTYWQTTVEYPSGNAKSCWPVERCKQCDVITKSVCELRVSRRLVQVNATHWTRGFLLIQDNNNKKIQMSSDMWVLCHLNPAVDALHVELVKTRELSQLLLSFIRRTTDRTLALRLRHLLPTNVGRAAHCAHRETIDLWARQAALDLTKKLAQLQHSLREYKDRQPHSFQIVTRQNNKSILRTRW